MLGLILVIIPVFATVTIEAPSDTFGVRGQAILIIYTIRTSVPDSINLTQDDSLNWVPISSGTLWFDSVFNCGVVISIPLDAPQPVPINVWLTAHSLSNTTD